jgi:X-Pro dipeptidyl-peptidase
MIRIALGMTLAVLATLLVAPPSAVAHIQGNRTMPVYDYADAIRESVWVNTPLDNDGDGVQDKIVVDLVRPRANGKIPVIMDASPYYKCCGRTDEEEIKEYASNGTITKFPFFYDNYFVPRGYAYAAVDFNGTARSTGCGDVGGREEVLGVKAVVDWLNGRASATYADGSPARATWTTGKVGMTGVSWDGTIANSVAATGVEGLETIVPIAAISSWYDYYRDNGALYTIDFGPNWLANVVSGRPETCAPVYDALLAGADNATGNYNSFWAERNYLPDARKVRASVFVVHGINDTNVETKHFARWWDALERHHVPRKIWLGQPGHVDPFDYRRAEWVDTLHRWFDYWLQDLPNDVMAEPMASIERTPDVWVDEPAWPATGAFDLPVSLGAGDGGGTAGTLGLRPGRGTAAIVDDPGLQENTAVAEPNTPVPGRQAFLSAPLPQDLRISGTPTVSLRVRVSQPNTELSARLVDYGNATRVNYFTSTGGIRYLDTESCWGGSTAQDDACYHDTAKDVITSGYGVLTRGWVDAAHRDSLTSPSTLQPDRWYTVTWPLNPYDTVLPKGRVLGLVITLSDAQFTLPTNTGATVDIDLANSRLTLPVSGSSGTAALTDLTRAPSVKAPATAGPAPEIRSRELR